MKLIQNWKAAHRWASVRLAAIAAFVAAYFTLNPDHLALISALVPEQYRPLVAVAIGMLTFGTAAGSRVVSFGELYR